MARRYLIAATASNRACGSPAHGSPTSFTGGVRMPASPRVVWGHDDSTELDQPEAVWRAVGNQLPAPATSPLVPLGDKRASRARANALILSKARAEFPYRKYPAQPLEAKIRDVVGHT